MKAKPAIEAVESIVKNLQVKNKKSKKILSFTIILLSPSQQVFTQKLAHKFSETDHLIFVCTRYEGIDYRFEQYMKKKYAKQFQKISI